MAELTVTQFKAQLVDQVGYQAEWRDQNALEYPDERNEQSSETLKRLAKNLAGLSESDLAWHRLQRAYARLDGVTASHIESETLRRYGFGYEPEDGGDAKKFLQSYAATLEQEAGVAVPQPAATQTDPVGPARRREFADDEG